MYGAEEDIADEMLNDQGIWFLTPTISFETFEIL